MTNGAAEALAIRLMTNRIASSVALLQLEVQVKVQAPINVEAKPLVRQNVRHPFQAANRFSISCECRYRVLCASLDLGLTFKPVGHKHSTLDL